MLNNWDSIYITDRRSLYSRGNTLVRKFQSCSETVKIAIFRAYVTPIYGCHLWTSYTVAGFQSVRTAYNSVARHLFKLPRQCSVSRELISRKLPTFIEIVRKHSYSLFNRLDRSSNNIAHDVSNPISYVTFGKVYYDRFM